MAEHDHRYVPKPSDGAIRLLDTYTGKIVGPWCITMAAAHVEAMKRNATAPFEEPNDGLPR